MFPVPDALLYFRFFYAIFFPIAFFCADRVFFFPCWGSQDEDCVLLGARLMIGERCHFGRIGDRSPNTDHGISAGRWSVIGPRNVATTIKDKNEGKKRKRKNPRSNPLKRQLLHACSLPLAGLCRNFSWCLCVPPRTFSYCTKKVLTEKNVLIQLQA